MKRKYKKNEILNPIQVYQLLNAIVGEDYRKDKDFINEWKKIPIYKKIYYRLETFYDSYIEKHFVKQENLMLPSVNTDNKENGKNI
jgi:hypothetical protein